MVAPLDLTGQRFGRLTAVSRAGSLKGEGVLWSCRCECGGATTITAKALRSGNTQSCGCLSGELVSARNRAAARHNQTHSPTWTSWMLMGQRCRNPRHKSYKDYGGRGIKVCERWESFENFLTDMGERPAGMTLERDRVNGDYEPGNCRWATSKEQGDNRRNSRTLTYKGVTKTVARWAEELGMSRHALRYRIDNGWTVEDAFETPLDHANGRRRASTC